MARKYEKANLLCSVVQQMQAGGKTRKGITISKNLRFSEAVRRLKHGKCNLTELVAELGNYNPATFKNH